MEYSADFRQIAREALCGKWLISALAAFIAGLLGVQGVNVNVNFKINLGNHDLPEEIGAEFMNLIYTVLPFLAMFAGLSAILGLINFIIGGAVKMGYARYNLNLVDQKESKLGDIFSQLDRLLPGLLMNLLTGLYTILWSLLFVIPGIVKIYSYAMTPYILYENPDLDANEAITRSRLLMDGNKFRLFCLHFSFIGWSLLCSLPTVIAAFGALLGMFWLMPLVLVSVVGGYLLSAYSAAAQAAFYRELVPTPSDRNDETNYFAGEQ